MAKTIRKFRFTESSDILGVIELELFGVSGCQEIIRIERGDQDSRYIGFSNDIQSFLFWSELRGA